MNRRHPNIVSVLGAVVEHGSEPLMVMEYLEQGTLRDLLRNTTIPVRLYFIMGLHMQCFQSQWQRMHTPCTLEVLKSIYFVYIIGFVRV